MSGNLQKLKFVCRKFEKKDDDIEVKLLESR